MSDEMNTTFTHEQISQQAQLNTNYLCLVAVAYLKEHARSMDEFWAFVGRRLAPGWEQGLTAKEVARWSALNMVSGGGNLRLLSGDESQAEVVIGGWPSEESLAFFELTQEEADTLWGAFGPIAESLGYGYKWRRQGDEVTMAFSLQSNG
jgi:hypothetical protein